MSSGNTETVLKETKDSFQKTLEWFSKEVLVFRGSRLSLGLLYNTPVEYYGSRISLKEIASLSFADSNTISIEPWDKSAIKNIEQALSKMEISGNIRIDGAKILFSFPPFTQEDREKMVKILNQKAEKAKIVLRQTREKTWHVLQEMEKQKEISEDEKFRGKDNLQKLTDEFQEKIEKLKEKKSGEILG
ncbi:MAG: ribosome recycling factor [Patescibacteria group bacterium]